MWWLCRLRGNGGVLLFLDKGEFQLQENLFFQCIPTALPGFPKGRLAPLGLLPKVVPHMLIDRTERKLLVEKTGVPVVDLSRYDAYRQPFLSA